MNARRAASAIALLLVVLDVTPARACGYCVEDKIATVYDSDIVSRAVQQKHRVAFFALVGALPTQDAALHPAIVQAVQSVHGVDAASARVSLESAALSFSFDPAATSFGVLHQRVARKLNAKGISLELLSVMEQPADLKVTRRSAR